MALGRRRSPVLSAAGFKSCHPTWVAQTFKDCFSNTFINRSMAVLAKGPNSDGVHSNNSKTSCCLPFVLCWPLPGGRIRMEVTLWSNGHHPCSRLHSQGGLGTTWIAAAAKPFEILLILYSFF